MVAGGCSSAASRPDGVARRGAAAPATARTFASVPSGAFRAVVIRVVDGDTFLANRGGRRVRVRLIGIDAPESVKHGAAVECFGRESANQLRLLLPQRAAIRASYQSADRRDRFGRELWDVWGRDGAFLQAELVRRGAAHARAYPPHTRYAEVLAAAERAARAARAGLHAACAGRASG